MTLATDYIIKIILKLLIKLPSILYLAFAADRKTLRRMGLTFVRTELQ